LDPVDEDEDDVGGLFPGRGVEFDMVGKVVEIIG
jgi:hypothetical protein